MLLTIHNNFHNTEVKIRVSSVEYNQLVSDGWQRDEIETHFWHYIEENRERNDNGRDRWRILADKLCPSRKSGCKCGVIFVK